jgi:DNA-binding NarL/FixJ family response regulator
MTATTPTVHIVDDDASFLAAASRLLRASGFAVKTFSSASDFFAQRDTDAPGCVVADLQMPEMNGLDAMIAIRDEFPEAKFIVLTTYTGDVQVLRAMKAGARGYLLKNLLHKELLAAIRAVHAGKKTLSADASYALADHAGDDALTPGELDVLRLIAAGNANKQIAAQLSITEDTVKGRVKNILSKLGANDRTHAAMIGIKRGIIDL